MGTTSSDSGNTSNGSTSSPRFGRVFHTGLGVNSMSLSSVFSNVGVNKFNDIQSDGGGEYSRHGDFVRGGVSGFGIPNGD